MDFTTLTKVTYSDQLVLTTEQLAESYGCSTDNLKKNFNANKDRFIEGKHYFKLEGEALKEFKSLVTESDLPISKFAPVLYLWTKYGAARHAKMLSTNEAWEVLEKLEEAYFESEEARFNSKNTTESAPKVEPAKNAQAKINVQPQVVVQKSGAASTPLIVQKQPLKLYEIIEDIKKSAELLVKMFDISLETAVSICKNAAETYYHVDLSAFDCLLLDTKPENFVLTPIDV